MEMSAPTKLPFSVLGEFAQSPVAQQTGQPPALSEANLQSVAVPIGVLDVPIGVWGSRRVETNSGQSERVEVFAEDTCTVIVFPQGAVIRLSASVGPGQLVVIANRKSGQIMLCRIVNVRTYPNIRGYAEIEFMHSATGFWGSYASQGTLMLTAQMAPPTPSACADFWSNGFPKEVVPDLASAMTASPAAPIAGTKKEPIEEQQVQIPFDVKPVQHMVAKHTATTGTNSAARFDATARNSSKQHIAPTRTSSPRSSSPRSPSPRPSNESSSRFGIGSLLLSWWPKRTFRTVTDRTAGPRRSFVFVSLAPALVLMAVLGVFLLHDGAGQPSRVNQTGAMPEVSLGSPIANVVQSPQPKSTSFVVPQIPIAKSENFPGAQTRALADNIRSSRPSTRSATSARNGTSEKKFPKGKLLPPHSQPNHSPGVGREAAPDLSRADSNTGVSPLQGVLATLQPRGGRAKEPELLSSSPPIYPALAKQAHIEGQVTIDAVVDTSGKLTNMTVISGAPLLREAALDSLRTWKYRPGYLNEKPVSTKTSITVNFRLR